MTRYEWTMNEQSKWRTVARNRKQDSQAAFAYEVSQAIGNYLLGMTTEESAEIMPEVDAE